MRKAGIIDTGRKFIFRNGRGRPLFEKLFFHIFAVYCDADRAEVIWCGKGMKEGIVVVICGRYID